MSSNSQTLGWQSGTAPFPGPADWCRESVTATTDLGRVIEAVVNGMAAQGYGQKDCFGMHLALEEAIVNALKHGSRQDPRKRVSVRYRVRSDRVLAEVEDEGEGFDPGQVPDPLAPEHLGRPGGRGLLLMRSYASWVRFNRKGNCVTLCKRRSA
jgi:serine/threonine-protein kinase RsbW